MYNQHQLSWIHPQLKVGTANQRHPFTRSDSSQHNSEKGKRNFKWKREQ